MSWSPFTKDSMQDPASGHQYLLSQCPVHRCSEFDPPFYTLSRFQDVASALRDTDLFSSEFGQGPRFTPPAGMLCDAPQHTHLRRAVQPAFTPTRAQVLRSTTEEIAAGLIDAVIAKGPHFDLHDDYAFPLPVTIIAGMLGVPDTDLERFKYWSDVQVAAMGAENPAEFAQDQEDFSAYLTAHLNARRAALATGEAVADDLLTLIASIEMPDKTPIPTADALSMLSQLLVGGNETTTSLITNVVWRLLEAPALWQALIDNPALIENAIEESLRYDPPVLGLYRNTTEDTSLHGTHIPKGAKVWLNYAAANRDSEEFDDPDVFKLNRPKRRHMSFGLGTHFCLGAPMARLEAQIALTTLVNRLPELTLAGESTRIAPFFLWGRRRLPLLTGSPT